MAVAEKPPEATLQEKFAYVLKRWTFEPVHFLHDVLGADPDPWQCDVLDALCEYDNVALRSCHGPGKTTTEVWAIIWFLCTRPFSKIPVTAPTWNKQVKDILFAEIHKWWRIAGNSPWAPWLTQQFVLHPTRITNKQDPKEWFAVGIASNKPVNVEGYHAPHLLGVFDEAKSIQRPTWESIHGMRTTQEAKFLVASTPGGPIGEFFNVFSKYRQTWKATFVIHPVQLQEELQRAPKPMPRDAGGVIVPGASGPWTYFSTRIRTQLIEERALEWGKDSPVFIAKMIGDFPMLEGDALIPYGYIAEAEDREQGANGLIVITCDVARYGKDRTVILAMDGGTVLFGEHIARDPAASTIREAQEPDQGDDPKQPRYRSTVTTADVCQRMRRQAHAAYIIIDDTGLGGGVTDELRKRGEQVIPINLGSAPTDRPKTPEQRAYRAAKHLGDSHFKNLKAQMGWALRGAFERGDIALARLPDHLRSPLIAQLTLVKKDMDDQGRITIVDPDEQEDESFLGAAETEGKKSPDHFHALLLGWWIAGTGQGILQPKGGQPKMQMRQIGRPRRTPSPHRPGTLVHHVSTRYQDGTK